MIYCKRCCIPSSQEGVAFDDMGICTACRTSEQKMHISWKERYEELQLILLKVKQEATSYDCILPISGGKDSFYQAHVLTKVFNLRPLAVTFSHNWYSETGFYNLQLCLKTFNLDHVQFTPSRDLVNRLARQSLFEIGDSCWHCHAGVGSFPLKIAVAFGIKLLIWGESICESSGRATYKDSVGSYDKDYFTKVSAKKTPEQIADTGCVSLKELALFNVPSAAEIDSSGVSGLHLGDYIFWDEERQTEFIKSYYGWRETEMESAYKGYKSAECIMAGVHDYMCYQKRGFSRASMQAAVDVRNGLMTREEGLALASRIDAEIPHALDYYKQITGLTDEEFAEEIARHRSPSMDSALVKPVEKYRKNAEVLEPFVEQILKRFQGTTDSRLTREDHAKLDTESWWS
jgi:N-acetyl sugar amidotransferase